ncbi:MAG: hypothetical protein AVDCRST_MAG87-2143 [uncultured Thermomicrobiales bacterium]|uniref:Uncharacterized protein n=1 Tax=uncultured Thermomicrobiales bacterium TaxID=1645740 RepID=A0A6J4V392_9BACT|nr:MAG: hypothetical protein AVDCRST_MAG87-2143 [uncultured Thermomicrobiales bacterium]
MRRGGPRGLPAPKRQPNGTDVHPSVGDAPARGIAWIAPRRNRHLPERRSGNTGGHMGLPYEWLANVS